MFYIRGYRTKKFDSVVQNYKDNVEIWVFVLVCIIVKCMEVGEDRGEVGCEKGIVVFLVKELGEKKRLHVVMWSIICLIIMLTFDF